MCNCILSATSLFFCCATGRRCSLVLSLVHADLHEDHVISQLNHVTSTNIVMSQFPEGEVVSKSCLCSVQHRKKSGKLLREVVIIAVVDNAQVMYIVWGGGGGGGPVYKLTIQYRTQYRYMVGGGECTRMLIKSHPPKKLCICTCCLVCQCQSCTVDVCN